MTALKLNREFLVRHLFALVVFAALAYPALKLAYHLKDLISEKVRDLLQRKKTKNNA